jgi:hypothetical protein
MRLYGLFRLFRDGDGYETDILLATRENIDELQAMESRAVGGVRTVTTTSIDGHSVHYWPEVPCDGSIYIVAALHDVDAFPQELPT